jgi:uncharacterized membrane protein YfcA
MRPGIPMKPLFALFTLSLAFLTIGSMEKPVADAAALPPELLLGSCSGSPIEPLCFFSCTAGNTITASGSGVGFVSGSCGGGSASCIILLSNPCPDGTKARSSSNDGTCLGAVAGTFTCSG